MDFVGVGSFFFWRCAYLINVDSAFFNWVCVYPSYGAIIFIPDAFSVTRWCSSFRLFSFLCCPMVRFLLITGFYDVRACRCPLVVGLATRNGILFLFLLFLCFMVGRVP